MKYDVFIYIEETKQIVSSLMIEGVVDDKIVLANGLNCKVVPSGFGCIVERDKSIFVDVDKIDQINSGEWFVDFPPYF